MKENPYPIAPEGLPFIVIALVLTLGLTYFLGPLGGVLPLAAFFFCIWFFRDPKRFPPPEEVNAEGMTTQTVLSPADGTIVDIQEMEEKRFLKRKTKRVSIFMSPLNVHINRSPVSGEVLEVQYNPGKYFNAASEKASLDNEQNAIWMKTAQNLELVFVQIAGFIARRIVCYPKPGDPLSRGQRMGLIRFGSRVDVYVPCEAEIHVGLKQKVVGGETILARIPGNPKKG
jgi:phosphatidylserine decarboxylase